MSFKEQLQKDVPTFINPREFGEHITIDGVETFGLWDDEAVALSGDTLDSIADANSFGLIAHRRVLYVYADTYAHDGVLGIPSPAVDQRLCINSEYWNVLPGTQESLGILKLHLELISS